MVLLGSLGCGIIKLTLKIKKATVGIVFNTQIPKYDISTAFRPQQPPPPRSSIFQAKPGGIRELKSSMAESGPRNTDSFGGARMPLPS